MGLKSKVSNLNYLEDDLGVCTRINVFSYKRKRPNDKVVRDPLSFITLPLPVNMPSDTYSMAVADTDLGVLGNITGFDPNNANDLSKLTATVAERLGFDPSSDKGKIASAMATIIAAAPVVSDALSSRALGLPIDAVAQAYTGIVRNPHTALLFNNVHLREFTFNWKLSPRSQRQSQTLNQIISTLKKAMHPNLQLGQFALDYPDLFTVNFNNDKEGVVNVDFSFLKSMAVNPTPNGHAYFRDGYPSVIDLSLTFHEIAIKTAEDFDGRFGNYETPAVSSSNPRGPR